jgi:hypothetical protein
VNFAVKASVIRDFLESRGIDYAATPSTGDLATPAIGENAKDAVASIECGPGIAVAVRESPKPRATGEHKPIERIRDLTSIAIASFGASDGAALVREKLSNRLVTSGRLMVVEDPEGADAVLTGVVGTDIYGSASTAAFKLTTCDGHIIWVGETSARGSRSASSDIADKIANGLLKAVEADSKRK